MKIDVCKNRIFIRLLNKFKNKMKYFLGVKNANELKSLYRKLCNELHPDKGGKAVDLNLIKTKYGVQSFQSKGIKQLN